MDFDYWEHQRFHDAPPVMNTANYAIPPQQSSLLRECARRRPPATATATLALRQRRAAAASTAAMAFASAASIVLDEHEEMQSIRALRSSTNNHHHYYMPLCRNEFNTNNNNDECHRRGQEEEERHQQQRQQVHARMDVQHQQREHEQLIMVNRYNIGNNKKGVIKCNGNNNSRMASSAAHGSGSGALGSMPSSNNYCSVSAQSPYQIRDTSSTSSAQQQDADGEAVCAVCGDGPAKLHYAVLACYGCKGFFRRTLSGKYHYVCRFDNDCIVDKFQRNSCRCCRFRRCLEVGMDPKAVRPDRDLTGKQRVPRVRKRALDEELINHMVRLQGNDWSRKISVEAKVLLMQLLNIESKVAKGDSAMDCRLGGGSDGDGTIGGFPQATTAHQQHQQSPLLPEVPTTPATTTAYSGGAAGGGKEAKKRRELSLRELFEQKPSLNTRRTEMCYEPYRMAQAEELPKIAHRGAIAAVDWVESLVELFDTVQMDTQDKISLVKACYAPLTIFNFSARTAQNTRNPDILCLCSYSYVPRKLPPDFNGSNHLSNNLIDRTLNELVGPLRKLALREEEVVPLKAIIILDPNARNLSPEAQRGVAELRDRVQDMLFHVVKELHPAHNAAQRFGNLLLLLPTISTLSGVMCENMQFCQVFGWTDPLLNELFETDADKCHAAAGTGGDCLFGGIPSASLLMSYSPPVLVGSTDAATTTTTNGSSSTLFNPADISLHSSSMFQTPTTHQQSTSASWSSSTISIPHSPSSISNQSPSSSSSSCSSSTRTMEAVPSSSNCFGAAPPASSLWCEISTQTDEASGGAEAVHYTDNGSSEYHHQSQRQQQDDNFVVSPCSNDVDDDNEGEEDRAALLSPLGVLFDDAELDSLCREHAGDQHVVAFDPLLFDHPDDVSSGVSSAGGAVDDQHHHLHKIDDDDLFRLMQ